MYVEDCDSAHAQATKEGATELMPVASMFWGDKLRVMLWLLWFWLLVLLVVVVVVCCFWRREMAFRAGSLFSLISPRPPPARSPAVRTQRMSKVRDPFGHCWAIATKERDLTPEQIEQGQKEWMESMAAGKK